MRSRGPISCLIAFLLFAVSTAQAGWKPSSEVTAENPREVQRLDQTAADAAIQALEAEKLQPKRIRSKLHVRLQSLLRRSAAVPDSFSLRAFHSFEDDNGSDGRTPVSVAVTSVSPRNLARLRRHGLEIVIINETLGVVQGRAPASHLAAIAALPIVKEIRPVERGRLRVGAVTSEGDHAARADLVRGLGYDGTDVKVGVISDGIDNVATAQASADLPPQVIVPADPRCRSGGGDEGTALLEIVHDLAPGAQLMFASGLASNLAFIDAVNCLKSAGAQIIVDDLGFPGEPFFEDGAVASAVRAAIQAGVSYHTAAGNEAQEHLEQMYRPSPSTSYHDFLGGPIDNVDDMVVGPFGSVTCVLQWNDPFGRSANDYDLFLVDQYLNVIDSSTVIQSGSQDPIEVVGAYNPAPFAQIAGIAIERFSGDARLLKLFCYDGLSPQYSTPSGSIVGHPALSEAVAVAAIDVSDPGLDDVEAFSSRGPAEVFFPSHAVRPKPDLAAFDGVSISNAGGFPSCPPFCRFFGTSPAGPHSAAVAALLLSKNPFLTPAQLQEALVGSAVDIGAPGPDDASGHGRLDAFAAAAAVPVPECLTDRQCDDSNACTTDSCNRGTCIHRSVTCDDGNACNGRETCNPAMGCVVGEPLRCDDGNVCNGAEMCNRAVGCMVGFTLDCDDRNPCTTDSCDPVSGCHHIALADGDVCDDGNLCNGHELCRAAICQPGVALDCNDEEPCTADTCEAARGCVHTPLGRVASITCLVDGAAATLAGAASADVVAQVRIKTAGSLRAIETKLTGALEADRVGKQRRERAVLGIVGGLLHRAGKTIRAAAHHGRMQSDLSERIAVRLDAAAGVLRDYRRGLGM
jgi:subtilisin family serine protease